MKWFVVVVMMWQPSGYTPLWIPYVSFENREECLAHVVENQFVLFAKAIQQYEGKITPQQISCVPEKGMQELLIPIDEQLDEEKRGV